MIDYCYHIHTKRCGHAIGTEEEYVKSAIAHNIKVLGFSDHVFLPGISQPSMRGNIEELDDYINTVLFLKEKYKDQIEIHLGFECEYGKAFESYYRDLLENKGFEYLILGQHLFFEEDGKCTWLLSSEDKDAALKRYVDTIIEGIKSGLFTYVAHPDLFIRMYKSVTPFVEEEIKRLCKACEEYDMPLEINLGGLRDKRTFRNGFLNYVNEEIFKIISKFNIRIIVGVDAHAPEHFDESNSDFAFAEYLIDKYKLNHITRLTFKNFKAQ